MKDHGFIEQLIRKGIDAKEKVNTEFHMLNHEQLNWKPLDNLWSINQCLEHLIISDGLRNTAIEKKIRQNFKTNIWENINPLRDFWGTVLVAQTNEHMKKKVKAPRIFQPSTEEIGIEIFSRFNDHIDNLIDHIKICIDADLDKVHVTSPISGFVSYSLRNAMTIIIGHERRHIKQATRVKKLSGFPS